MAKLNIKRSIQVGVPANSVFEKLNDFNHWQAWSPWLIQDPKAKVKIAADGKSFNWVGDLTGEGQMEILKEEPNRSIDYDLIFLKPWKSKAKVRFELEEQGENTKVSWLMDSSLPFFLFFMKKMMAALIGMDYERGLALLKDYVEDGEVHSKLDFQGVSEYPGCTYIGIRTSCTSEEVGPKMQKDLETIWHFIQDQQDLIAGAPFSIYHKFDMVNGDVDYTSGLPLKEIPADLPAPLFSGNIPATKVYTLQHTGPYEHLGNAWSTMYNMHQRKKFKMNKSIPPFETYENNPEEVDANDLVTKVHFALK